MLLVLFNSRDYAHLIRGYCCNQGGKTPCRPRHVLVLITQTHALQTDAARFELVVLACLANRAKISLHVLVN